MKVDGILERAQLEPRTSDLANTITGAIWYRTDTSVVKVSSGSGYHTLSTGTVDASTLQNVADVLSIKDLGVVTGKIADAAVTSAKLAAAVAGAGLSGGAGTALAVNVDASSIIISGDTLVVGPGGITKPMLTSLVYNLSSSCGNYTTASGAFTTVTNMSIAITTTGRPIYICLVPDGSTNECYAEGVGGNGYLRFRIDSTLIATHPVRGVVPLGGFNGIYAPGAGSYTFTCDVYTIGTSVDVKYAKLLVYEM